MVLLWRQFSARLVWTVEFPKINDTKDAQCGRVQATCFCTWSHRPSVMPMSLQMERSLSISNTFAAVRRFLNNSPPLSTFTSCIGVIYVQYHGYSESPIKQAKIYILLQQFDFKQSGLPVVRILLRMRQKSWQTFGNRPSAGCKLDLIIIRPLGLAITRLKTPFISTALNTFNPSTPWRCSFSVWTLCTNVAITGEHAQSRPSLQDGLFGDKRTVIL